MLSGTLRPLARRFPFPQRTTNHHDDPRQVDPMCRKEDHLAVKSDLDGMEIIEQTRMVVPPAGYPVVHHFPIEMADIRQGLGDYRYILLAPSTRFRSSRTDGTHAFEVVCFQEVFLTRFRRRARF